MVNQIIVRSLISTHLYNYYPHCVIIYKLHIQPAPHALCIMYVYFTSNCGQGYKENRKSQKNSAKHKFAAQ